MERQGLTKNQQVAADLDAARCHGNWAAIPDLAKRYKKYHPNEKVLEAVARLEAEYALLVNFVWQGDNAKPEPQENITVTSNVKVAGTRKTIRGHKQAQPSLGGVPFELKWPDAHHQNDDPHRIAVDPHPTVVQAEYLLKQILDIIASQYKASEDLESNDDWQAQLAKIIAARIYLETDRPHRAFEILQNLALRMDDVRTGYGLVLLVQARIIKGMCLEHEDDIPAALEAYDGAWDVVERNPMEKGEILSYWIEQGLYRSVLLRLRVKSPVKPTLKAMRAYMHMASSHWSAVWRIHKRWIIFRHYAQYLTKVCKQPGAYYPMPISNPLIHVSPKSVQKTSAYEEFLCLSAQFKSLHTNIITQLDDKSKTQYTLELTKLLVTGHDTIGWGEITNLKRTQQFLVNVYKETFNNVLVARYMFLTLLRSGDFEASKHAFRIYMELVGLPDVDKTDENGTEITARDNMDVSEKVELIVNRLSELRYVKKEKEKEVAVAKVLIAGILLYGQELKDYKVAASLSDLLIEFAVQVNGRSKDWNPVMVDAYRLRGVCYGVLASQSDDPENRTLYRQEALDSLKEAIKVNKNCWRSHYELAVQYAHMKDIVAATKSVGQSLQINPKNLSAWHLLALIYSCNDMRRGLATIQTALRDNPVQIPANIQTDYPVIGLNPNETESARESFNKAENYLLMRMTQIRFIETVDGPNAVMKLYNDLFSTFAKLSQKLGIDLGTLLESSQKAMQEVPVTPSGSPHHSVVGRSSRSKSIASTYSERRSSRRHTDFDWEALGLERAPPIPKQRGKSVHEDSSSSQASLGPALERSVSVGKTRKKSLSIKDIRLTRFSRSSQTASSKDKSTSNGSPLHVSTILNESSTTVSSDDSQKSGTPSDSSTRVDPNSLERMDTTASLVSVLTAESFTTLTSESSSKPPAGNSFTLRQQKKWTNYLIRLWVMSATTYLKANRTEEASKAVMEAENLGQNNVGVWHLLGKLCLQAQTEKWPDLQELGIESFKKALSLDPRHLPTHIDLASAYIKANEYELAEGLLERTTKGPGWDSAEAWYLLGTVYKHLNDTKEATDCLTYALQLCESTPLIPFYELPRFI